MGSSSSSNSVKSINLEQNGEKSADKSSATSKTQEQDKKGRKHGSGATETKEAASKSPTSTPPPPTADRDAQIIELTRQLCESESQRLDLEDKIEALEENLEYNNAQNLLQAEKPCDETLHAKDQYIVKLEKEKTDLQTDLNKMRQKHKRKLKQFNSQMAEYKQETNFQMMELKEEIQKLKQDNKKLQGTSGKANDKVVSELDEDTPKLPGGEKMKLILELSEQVTEQGDKISKLEKKLKDKDLTVDELRVKLKNNTEYLKAIDEKKDSVKVGSGDRNNNYNGCSLGRTVNRDSFKSSAVKSSKLNAPLAQDTDDDFTDAASMKKLTSMLQGFKAKTEVGRLSIDSIDECRETAATKGVSIVEEGVGTGRDSGLGSAGKREEAKANTATATASNQLDWNSMDSDSEADGNQFIQSKILSAPPHLQGVRTQKLKKKNSSLKNRSSQRVADRPPKPGLAFVSKAEDQAEEEEDIWDGHPLSPIMSPVEVS